MHFKYDYVRTQHQSRITTICRRFLSSFDQERASVDIRTRDSAYERSVLFFITAFVRSLLVLKRVTPHLDNRRLGMVILMMQHRLSAGLQQLLYRCWSGKRWVLAQGSRWS